MAGLFLGRVHGKISQSCRTDTLTGVSIAMGKFE